MSVTSDLFLVLTRPDGQPEPWGTARQYALTAGVVSDLVAAGAAQVGHHDVLRLGTGVAAGTALLDSGAERLNAYDGKPLRDLLGDRALDLTDLVGEGLAVERVVAPKNSGLLHRQRRYLPTDSQAGMRVRRRLAKALERTPDATDRAVLSILTGTGVLARALAHVLPDESEESLVRRVQGLTSTPTGVAAQLSLDAVLLGCLAATFVPTLLPPG